ncbi:AMP-binding protein [Ilumatobacter sp.]|uniref:AMP-binding protein n=1 Tax=Ilumatobacter sp. TaxID=1967498 RepID=UPI003AF55BFA
MALGSKLQSGAAIAKSVLTPFERPDRFVRSLAAMAPWGSSLAGLVAGAATRYPDAVAIVDDAGETTYAELWKRSQAIAAGLAAHGVTSGISVGLLARNHRGFVEAATGVAAAGGDLVLLNTGFAGPQIADVVGHEQIEIVIHDDEFTAAVEGSGARITIDEAALDELARAGTVEPPDGPGRVVILTSGTTGRPKGAARKSDDAGIEGVGAVLDRIPLRLRDTQVVAAPLFHAWGLSHLLLGLARSTTNVLARRFEPEQTLGSVSRHRAEVLVVVPVMMSRILDLGPDALSSNPTSELRAIAASGSAIGSGLVTRILDQFGPVLYNLYGSTEVAVATIATPDDLRIDPSTAGRVALGSRVEILDHDGNPVPEGQVGRVFVGSAMPFEGYTNGGDKERIRGLLSSGDMGRFVDGLLFVEGRDDDMIVSGGENVFPAEVEELLRAHPSIADAAVIGVDDDEFGQALAAFVVTEPGANLTVKQVRTHVKDHLARHKVPRTVTFIDELPRNATGKLLRRSLNDMT